MCKGKGEWVEFKHAKIFLFYEGTLRILINLKFNKHIFYVDFGSDLHIEHNFQTKIKLEKKYFF